MSNNSKVILRQEEEADHLQVETIARDAFWNLYFPGCDEHFLIHRLRERDDFLPEFSLVAEMDGEVVGSIQYSKSRVEWDNGQVEHIVTFGPLSVSPSKQGKGIGKKLVNESIDKVKTAGFSAVLILGYPQLYEPLGFVNGHEYGIGMMGQEAPKGLQIKKLTDDPFLGKSGQAIMSDVFEIDPKDVEEFDGQFESKEKYETKSQQAFRDCLALSWSDEVPESVIRDAHDTNRIE